MCADDDPAAFDSRIEALTRALEASSDVDARQSARELVRLVLEFHGIGLRRLLDVVAEAPVGLRQRIVNDPVVAGVLALHDLGVPDAGPGRTRDQDAASNLIHVRRAADAARPIALHANPSSRCERCGAPLAEPHRHFVDLVSRRLSCSCGACWLLSGAHVANESLRPVPDRYVTGEAFRLTEAQWDALQVPVTTAFFMFNGAIGRTIAFYPSPAGATESALPLAAWHDVERMNAWVRAAAPDVEAILVRKNVSQAALYDAFIVPIDACYELVGRIRVLWRGVDGGEEVRAEIDRFFRDIAARSADKQSVNG